MSSDSDDDIYGNIIKKRDKILSNYTAKIPETKEESFLDDSILVDDKNSDSEHDTSLSKRLNTKRKAVVKGRPSKRNRNIDSDSELSLSELRKTIRKTSKKINTSKRVQKTVLNSDDSIIEIIDASINDTSRRGSKKTPRGRGRGKNLATRGRHRSRSERNGMVRELANSLSLLSDVNTNRYNNSDGVLNSDDSIVEIIDDSLNDSRGRGGKQTSRGRGRGRGRKTSRGRSTGTPRHTQNPQYPTVRGSQRARSKNNEMVRELTYSIPTYSVGNTEEYDDELENVALFSSMQDKNDVVLFDDTGAEENEELSVKVYWQSIDIHKFKIRKYQKIKEIFEFFSERENIPMERLLFTYNDRIIKQDDTPDSIDYNIAKFIDGGHTIGNINNLTSKVNMNKVKTTGIKLKFQYQKSQKPLEVFVEKDDKLSMAMTKCAEFLELPLKKLKFVFDGDVISGSETMRDLDMEGGECIDVKIVD